MRQRRHPLSGALYEVRADGLVQVSKDGKMGIFQPDGTFVSGDIRWADAHLCGWLAGPRPANAAGAKDHAIVGVKSAN